MKNIKQVKSNHQFEELDQEILKKIEGGAIPWGPIGVLVGVALWAVSEWDCLVEGYNEVRK